MSLNHIRPWRHIERRKSRQIMVGNVPVGGDAPISVQTMTNTLTTDVKATIAQIQAAADAGADIVRVSVPDEGSSRALRDIVPEVSVPIVADIHFHYKRGIEAVCMRIFSAAPPTNARAIGTWLSTDDLIQMVEKSITSPVVGLTTVYGISNNDRAVVDNSKAGHLGFHPKDNAEDFAADVFAATPPLDNKDPANLCIGGPFATVELGNSGVAGIKAMNNGDA